MSIHVSIMQHLEESLVYAIPYLLQGHIVCSLVPRLLDQRRLSVVRLSTKTIFLTAAILYRSKPLAHNNGGKERTGHKKMQRLNRRDQE
jgi:hypothetical protein